MFIKALDCYCVNLSNSVTRKTKNNIEQYAGRLNRDYLDKEYIIIFDYVDNQIPMLSNMYKKRIRIYHKIGFSLVAGL